jgi:hypothetical protein
VVRSALVFAAVVSVSGFARATHPLHTTLAQVTADARGGAIDASIRVFAGDFAFAVAKRNGASAPADDRVSDAASFAYVAATFRVTDAEGKAAPLTWCGSRREGDVLWLCVRAAAGATGARLEDRMLFELFDDQINIVQTTDGAKKSSVLFTKGDGAKPLL